MEPELKPCPFCGGEAKRGEHWKAGKYIMCSKCNTAITDVIVKTDLTTAWNTRVYPKDVQAAIERSNPKTAIKKGSEEVYQGYCPDCHMPINSKDQEFNCNNCGQRLDWDKK